MYSLHDVTQGLAQGGYSVTCIERMDEKESSLNSEGLRINRGEVSEAGERMRRLVCEDLTKQYTHREETICTEEELMQPGSSSGQSRTCAFWASYLD